MTGDEGVRHGGNDKQSTQGLAIGRRQFVALGATVTAATAGLTAFGGQAAAHFEEKLKIDVRPGSDRNPIKPGSHGIVPVAVLQTEDFDPAEEDVRYRFGAPDVVAEGGGARPIRDGVPVDVNRDDSDDLVLFFPTDEAGFDGDEESARLVWEESSEGEHGLAGTDDVTIVGRDTWWD